MLHYRMELSGNYIFQKFDFNDSLGNTIGIFIEEIQTVTKAKVISFSSHTLILGVFLS